MLHGKCVDDKGVDLSQEAKRVFTPLAPSALNILWQFLLPFSWRVPTVVLDFYPEIGEMTYFIFCGAFWSAVFGRVT